MDFFLPESCRKAFLDVYNHLNWVVWYHFIYIFNKRVEMKRNTRAFIIYFKRKINDKNVSHDVSTTYMSSLPNVEKLT